MSTDQPEGGDDFESRCLRSAARLRRVARAAPNVSQQREVLAHADGLEEIVAVHRRMSEAFARAERSQAESLEQLAIAKSEIARWGELSEQGKLRLAKLRGAIH